MTYTAEQLRERADRIESLSDGMREGAPLFAEHIKELRAHAAALEELAALRAQLEAQLIAWKAQQFHLEAEERENELLEAQLAERDAENAVLRDAIKDALPWMIKLGDYIGNGTQADPMGRCNAILKMRIAVEKRDD